MELGPRPLNRRTSQFVRNDTVVALDFRSNEIRGRCMDGVTRVICTVHTTQHAHSTPGRIMLFSSAVKGLCAEDKVDFQLQLQILFSIIFAEECVGELGLWGDVIGDFVDESGVDNYAIYENQGRDKSIGPGGNWLCS